jgi:hypothetical protein
MATLKGCKRRDCQNYKVDTREKKKKKKPKKNVDGRCTSSHEKKRHLEADQWLSGKEWCLGSGRRRQLSQDRIDR